MTKSTCSSCPYNTIKYYNGAFGYKRKQCVDEDDYEVMSGYCPICNKSVKVVSNKDYISCSTCGHHVVLWVNKKGE